MNENEEFTHVQRRLCAVIAKSEWTSSRMRMQKSGEELRESRAKSHRTANQFLQDLLGKRTDSDLIDDNGAVDRYHKFVKYKSTSNDDSNNTLDEFDRRLRALNNNRQNQQIKKVNNSNVNIKINENKYQQINHDLQSTIEIQNDKKDIVQQSKPSRILPTITTIPITSTPNDTTNELTTSSVFQDNDEIQELSNVHSNNISSIDSEANHIESPIDQQQQEQQSKTFEKTETLNSSTSSLTPQILYAPKARRSDGTEIVHSSSLKNSLPRTSSNISLFNQCYFPRSLTSHGKLMTTSISKRQLPSLPIVQIFENEKQFQTDDLYDLLDHLNEHSSNDFTNKLNQLTLSNNIIQQNHIEINDLINEQNYEEKENILPNLFQSSSPSSSIEEKLFYSTLNIPIDDPKNLFLYTMTLSTVQLSPSVLLPYSILNGRRPLLKCSNQTNFKQFHSKQPKYTYEVTAIELSLNTEQIQQNDIILKINDQSVWGFTTDSIIEILQQLSSCSLTVARLCQPFI